MLAVPVGSGFDGVAHGIGVLMDSVRRTQLLREATEWTFAGIDAVRAAPGCTWTTDEEIAGEILRRIGSKKPDT
jgi:hypothetical protein